PSDLGAPGEFPYVRGVYPTMYRGRPWTMRQYAGYATAAESNARYRYLLDHGQTGLSVAFDLPTQMGYDSDDPVATAEVGKVGVAIDSLADMRTLFDGIPLDKVSTSMTINAPASVLLMLYQLVGEEQGVDPAALTGTIQNDILKEYIARGTYIYPPEPSMRLITDTFAYCAEQLPKFNTISISGYHLGEKGATAVQEVAFTLADAIAYVQAAIDAGLSVDSFGPRLSFFFVARTSLLEEVAKFRAARALWANIMQNRFGAKDPRSLMLRFHTQTAGVQLTAQQPENNIVRVAIQALAAVLGGTQSLHCNSFDEALALPTERAAKIALRTQQIIAAEGGVVETADPLGGSWFVESLTQEITKRAQAYLDEIDKMGGAVRSIEYMQREIEDAAYREQKEVEARARVVVGVNEYVEANEAATELLRVEESVMTAQIERVRAVRAQRDEAPVKQALEDLRDAAKGTDNLLVPIREALRAMATVGEVCGVMREVFGVYRPRA
ncbi:MAG TPA: methylmalonyl-CoA mutase family protein, partial [Actinomycetota bacterium]|nr:methylmalonyl-CoA mutase family protein [Actinomycetota bacterium]